MTRPGFSFLVCPDSRLLREELSRQLDTFAPEGSGWQKLIFWGDLEPGSQYWESLNQNGLFITRRAVVARNAQEWPASVWKAISQILCNKYENVWPLFCLEVPYEKGKFKIPAHILKTSCFTFADRQKWVWRQMPLNSSSMRKYVLDKARSAGITFCGNAINLFCEYIRPDASAITNEIDKLRLVSRDGKITEDLISRDSNQLESDAFNCIKKLENGDISGAWQEMQRGSPATMLFFLLALMARELRLLWQVKYGPLPLRLNPQEAREKTRLAQRLSPAAISLCFSLVADAELQVKSGRLPPEQALENFLVSICKIFSNNG